jgi:hypothetical protein
MAAHLGYADTRQFAHENLLASEGVQVTTDQGRLVSLPTLVPATADDGHCKFLDAGRCVIHAVSPFGCAFIDAHLPEPAFRLRADALYRDLHSEWQARGEYAAVWEELQSRRLRAPPLATRQYRLAKALRREKLT